MKELHVHNLVFKSFTAVFNDSNQTFFLRFLGQVEDVFLDLVKLLFVVPWKRGLIVVWVLHLSITAGIEVFIFFGFNNLSLFNLLPVVLLLLFLLGLSLREPLNLFCDFLDSLRHVLLADRLGLALLLHLFLLFFLLLRVTGALLCWHLKFKFNIIIN